MRREIDAYHRSLERRYVKSKRHTIQVDFLDYQAELKKERAEGARRRGRPRSLSVPAAEPEVATSA
jgi:hypothetical protein